MRTNMLAFILVITAFFIGYNAGVHHAIEDAYIRVDDTEVIVDIDGNEYIHVIE